ncbi:MAG TPA: hypothetical protein PLH77_00760, partial [Bacilli bacterium]|nr:hypothetical protein [Bacilli bacterium]
REKSYKIREWYSLCASFRTFNEEEIELRYLPSNISPSYLKEIYVKNVKMATFYSVIAPLIFFFLVGIFFLIVPSIITTEENSKMYCYILGAFLILGSFIIFFQHLLGKRSCFIRTKRQNRYHFITKKEHLENLKIFDIHIKKEKE